MNIFCSSLPYPGSLGARRKLRGDFRDAQFGAASTERAAPSAGTTLDDGSDIPVSHDLKDLQSQIDWAKRNDQLAHLISERASNFMEPFTSVAKEEKSEAEIKIQSDVARAYTALLRQITGEHPSKC